VANNQDLIKVRYGFPDFQKRKRSPGFEVAVGLGLQTLGPAGALCAAAPIPTLQ